jgi:hypothetical protein
MHSPIPQRVRKPASTRPRRPDPLTDALHDLPSVALSRPSDPCTSLAVQIVDAPLELVQSRQRSLSIALNLTPPVRHRWSRAIPCRPPARTSPPSSYRGYPPMTALTHADGTGTGVRRGGPGAAASDPSSSRASSPRLRSCRSSGRATGAPEETAASRRGVEVMGREVFCSLQLGGALVVGLSSCRGRH